MIHLSSIEGPIFVTLPVSRQLKMAESGTRISWVSFSALRAEFTGHRGGGPQGFRSIQAGHLPKKMSDIKRKEKNRFRNVDFLEHLKSNLKLTASLEIFSTFYFASPKPLQGRRMAHKKGHFPRCTSLLHLGKKLD